MNREASGSGPTAAVHQAGMSSNIEPAGPASSFTARRPNASNLPNFELPPPQLLNQKYIPLQHVNTGQQAPATLSVGNLLTPPSNIPGDNLSPVSSGVNSSSPAAAQGLPPFTPSGFWQQTASGTTPLGMSSGTTPQPWSQNSNPLFPLRAALSPSSLGSLIRNNTNSPTTSEGLPPPPYDLNQLPPFPTSMSMPAPTTLPAIAAQQQQQHQQQQQQAIAQLMGVPTPVSATTTQASPTNATDNYSQRPPPTPSYYGGSQPSSTPQQSNFPAFHNPSPVQQSPLSANAQTSRLSPTNGQIPGFQSGPPTQAQSFMRPYPAYSLPGPIMSNMHSPNQQMTVVGGLPHHTMPGNVTPYTFNSGQAAAHMQQMYGPAQQTAHNERPFKCDQCPQSFNRNHDLKRHKRIHLAVKPFPCGHCEKSFSRKDALKVGLLSCPSKSNMYLPAVQRHILVKGCGKGSASNASRKAGDSSPNNKSEAASSDNDENASL
ncbi:MAG: hypothetical protein Q9191_001202 [Dirinaria sp. TL-2023a]